MSEKAKLLEYLKTAILTVELRPGQDLDEMELSTAFGLSRTPLREIFRELAGEGFIELRTGRGARVSEMSHKTLHDFFRAAPMIYSAILRLAAQNASQEQIAELNAAQAQFRTALAAQDVAARALANNRFHAITGEMADNVYLNPSFQRLLIDHARIAMVFYRQSPSKGHDAVNVAADQHDAIIAAISHADTEEAGRIAHAHWQLSRDQIESFVMPAPLAEPLGDLLTPNEEAPCL